MLERRYICRKIESVCDSESSLVAPNGLPIEQEYFALVFYSCWRPALRLTEVKVWSINLHQHWVLLKPSPSSESRPGVSWVLPSAVPRLQRRELMLGCKLPLSSSLVVAVAVQTCCLRSLPLRLCCSFHTPVHSGSNLIPPPAMHLPQVLACGVSWMRACLSAYLQHISGISLLPLTQLAVPRCCAHLQHLHAKLRSWCQANADMM